MFAIRIGEDEEHEFDFADPDNQEIMVLEELFDGPYGEFLEAFGKRSARAKTALVAVCRRRQYPLVQMRDVRFKLNDFRIVNLDALGNEKPPPEVDPANPTGTPTPTESPSDSSSSDGDI